MPKSITFVGVHSGDGECFCWIVTEEQYEAICGADAVKFEKEYHESYCNDTGEAIDYGQIVWQIYPSDLIRYLTDSVRDNGKPVKITMTLED